MKTKNFLRDVRRNVVIGISLLSLARCADRGTLLFDGEIEGQKVRYFDGDVFTDTDGKSDVLEVYSKEDGERLYKVFVDEDENGVIGDNPFDRYEVYDQNGIKVVYKSLRVIDKNGRVYGGSDEISRTALEISRTRLKEATGDYQRIKQKIQERLGQEL